MRKHGINFGGYDSSVLAEVDPPVRDLVRALNDIPYIVTYSSCGGHEERFWNGVLLAQVDYEVFDRARAERLYRRILRTNWAPHCPGSWVDFGINYNNAFNFNPYNVDPMRPEHEDRLISSDFISIRGISEIGPEDARRNQTERIAQIVRMLNAESVHYGVRDRRGARSTDGFST